MKPRVLVADDSHYVRLVVARALEHAGIDVVGFARDGEEAVELNLDLEPDVIVLDLQMPRMNGVEALRRIRETRPAPVLVFASLSPQGAHLAVEALAEGAAQILAKPSRGALALDLATHVWGLVAPRGAAPTVRPRSRSPFSRPRLVLVAASTGGPPCVEALLRALPQDSPPVVVAQHMPPGFTRAFAERLDRLGDLTVFEGSEGDRIPRGGACILPGGAVGTVENVDDRDDKGTTFALRVHPGSAMAGARPNATALFLSGLGAAGSGTCAIVLTGMGADGADAVPALVARGATVIAQDPSEALIPSMPNAAIAGGAQHVEKVSRIPRLLATLAAERSAGARR